MGRCVQFGWKGETEKGRLGNRGVTTNIREALQPIVCESFSKSGSELRVKVSLSRLRNWATNLKPIIWHCEVHQLSEMGSCPAFSSEIQTYAAVSDLSSSVSKNRSTCWMWHPEAHYLTLQLSQHHHQLF